jgi:hypothetical protein
MDILTEKERNLLLSWNQTEVKAHGDKTIVTLFP